VQQVGLGDANAGGREARDERVERGLTDERTQRGEQRGELVVASLRGHDVVGHDGLGFLANGPDLTVFDR
jgi:dihydrodipicolinate reductase